MRGNGWLITALLGLLVLAVLGDILIRSQSVHAQTPPTLYIDTVDTATRDLKVSIRGSEFIAFSCANGFCNILSK